MHRQVGDLAVDADGIALSGVIVRHLVMPGLLADSAAIMTWIAAQLSTDRYVNVMDQYRPDHKVLTTDRYASIDRPITSAELAGALTAARDAGLCRIDRRWRPMRH